MGVGKMQYLIVIFERLDVLGVLIGCAAIILSLSLYLKNKRHTDERFDSVEGLAKSANRKAGQAGKAVGAHNGHKKERKKKGK